MVYYISSGQVSSGIILTHIYMYVSSGGTANSTTVNSGGRIYVSSGGMANDTTLNSSSLMYVSSGGTATDTTVNSGGKLTVSRDGTVNFTTVNSGGFLYVSSAGMAKFTTVNSGGKLAVSSGGTANSTTVDGVYYRYGYLHVFDGGTANNTTVDSYGYLAVDNSGMANSTVVNKIGSMHVSSGGTANNTTVNSGGSMYVSSGGTANEIVENGGYTYVADGAEVTFTPNTLSGQLINLGATVHSGTTAVSITVNSGGSVTVSSGGTANNTTVNSGGNLWISSGGTANNTTVNGHLGVYSGGTATGITLFSGGGLGLTVAQNTYIQGTSDGSAFEMENAFISGCTVNSNSWLSISSGGTANNITLNGGCMYVSRGGTALEIIENGGYVNAAEGANVSFASNTFSGLVLLFNSATVHSGTTANSTTVNGHLDVYSSGTANSTTVNSTGRLDVYSGGTANCTTVHSTGHLDVNSKGTVNSTTVNSCGYLYVYSGGTANCTTVNHVGVMCVNSDGTTNSTTVNSCGYLYVSSGGKITGPLNIASEATVSAYTGSIIDFDISGKTAESSALVNNLSLIQGTPDFTITVSATQKAGSYTLAGGAAGFTGTLTIGTLETNYGTITVNGNALTYGDYTYTLASDTGNLLLKIVNDRICETPSLVVTTAEDVVDETDDVTSLREAIAYAATLDGEQTITFKIPDADIIQLNDTLYITSPVVIDGQNAETDNNVTIRVAVSDAEARQNNLSASDYDLLNVSGANHFTLNNLTLMGGAGNVAVFSDTVDYFHSDGLTIKDSYGMFSLSEMIQRGEVDHFYSVNCVQGINFGKNSIVRNSTFDGSMLQHGENNGGPLNAGPLGLYSTMTVINSTLLNHDVPHSGAAIYVQNQLVNLVNCTIENACGHLGIGNSLCSVLGGTFNLLNTIVVTPDGSGIPDIGAAFGSTNTIRYSVYGAAGNSIASNAYPGYDSEDLFVSVGQTSDNGGATPTLTLRSDATVLDNAVLAAVDPETHTLYYSTDNGSSWILYSDGRVASVNPDWIIDTDQNGISRLTGNKIGASVVCGNSIESMIPDKPTASADITTATNQNVTVSARFSNDAVIKQYSLDNINWRAYTSGIVMTANGTVYFRAGNASGYSDTVRYTVDNIDKAVPVLTGEPSASVNDRNVMITWQAAIDNTGATGYQIKIGENIYSTTGTSYSLASLAAGTYVYQIRACDAANNYSEWSNAKSFQIVPVQAQASVFFYNGNSLISSGTILNNLIVSSGCSVYVSSGGTAVNTMVGSEGELIVACGGVANSTTVNRSGYLYISSGGVANVTTVSSGGVYVQDGTANNTTLNKSSWMDVDGGTANNTTVNSSSFMLVSNGGMAANTIINSGGAMSIIGEDMMQEHCDLGPMATNTTVNSGGCLHLEGGIGNNISVNAGGRLMIGYGKVKGSLQIASGAYVTAAMGGIMEFDISGRTANSSALVNDLSLIDRAIFLYTITISATQANGTYTLAGGASDFNDTFNIGTAETNYGELTVNGAVLTYGDTTYKLATSKSSLLLTVSDKNAPPAPAPVPATVIEDIGAVAIGEIVNGTLGYDGNIQDNASFAVETAGKYRLTGNFGTLNAAVTISGGTKTVAKGTVKNGVLTFNNGNPVLLTAGDYSLVLKSSDKGKTASDYTFAVNAETVFDQGDADSWVNPRWVGNVSEPGMLVEDGWVGYGDEFDYLAFTLDYAANLSLDYTAAGAAKFTLYDHNKKAVMNSTLKAGAALTVKPKLLEAGQYYLAVQSTNAKKGDSVDYTVGVNDSTVFFTEGDNGDDSWNLAYDLGELAVPGELVRDWVGFGDESDYRKFTLDTAAKLSFTVDSSDAAKFTVWQLQPGGKLKSLQSTTLKAGQELNTKELLLVKGDYYFSVQSTNAKKGGNADYTVTLNGKSAFFTEGDNGDDTWNHAYDLGELAVPCELVRDWVGFGDESDYRKFTLDTAAKLSFTADSTDAAKFTVWQLQANGKLKSLQSTTLKAGQELNTKELLLVKGDYYFSVQSTNAKKGGDADYGVTVNAGSVFFPAGDNSNDIWKAAAGQEAFLEGEEITGWVGFGDAADFIKFELAGNGRIQLELDEATAEAYKSKQIKLTCLDSKGKSVALGVLDGDTLVSKKPVATGKYYLGITCANVNKFDTSYSVTTGLLATA